MRSVFKTLPSLLLTISLGILPLMSLSQDTPWVKELRKTLPPFKIERIRPDNVRALYDPSPKGNWFIEWHEYYRKSVTEGGGTFPIGIRLYDKYGKFMRDLTYPKFYYVKSFGWSPSGNAIFFLVDPTFARNPENAGLWKVDLRTNSFYHYNAHVSINPSVPINLKAYPYIPWICPDDLPAYFNDGNSYLTIGCSTKTEIYYNIVWSKQKYYLYRVWIKPKKIHLITSGNFNGMFISPDERWFIYTNKHEYIENDAFHSTSELWRMDVNGNKQKCLIGRNILKLTKEQSQPKSYPSKLVDSQLATNPTCELQSPMNKYRWSDVKITGYWWIASKQPKVIVAAHGEYEWGDGSNWIWLMNVNGRILKKAPIPGTVQLISGSADGKHFYFSSGLKSPDGNIANESYYRVTIDGGE